MSLNVILTAPFSAPVELNTLPYLDLEEDGKDLSQLLNSTKKTLQEVEKDWWWSLSDEGIIDPGVDATATAYSGIRYRAPTQRPPYFVSGTLCRRCELWRDYENCAASLGWQLIDVGITLQDYGVGVLSIKCSVPIGEMEKTEFSERLIRICEELAPLSLSGLFRAVKNFYQACLDAGCKLSDNKNSLIHREPKELAAFKQSDLELQWFHSLVMADVTKLTIGDSFFQQFKAGDCILPKTGTFLDGATRFRRGEMFQYQTRYVDAYIFFGWGNSIVFYQCDDTANPEEEIPARYVLSILQMYSCGIYKLNKELLIAAVGAREEKYFKNTKEYNKKVDDYCMLRGRVDLFLSLTRDQKYAQSGFERSIWQRMSSAWELDQLTQDVKANIGIVVDSLEEMREIRNRGIANRVTWAVTIITAASSSAIIFSVIDEFYKAPLDLEKVTTQIGVISLLVLGAALFLSIGSRRR